MSIEIKHIGYWRDKEDNVKSRLPWPEENSTDPSDPEQKKIIAKLKGKLLSMNLVSYKGISMCRICGERNGHRELEIRRGDIVYGIPEGYMHYLTVHNVKADPLLLDIL